MPYTYQYPRPMVTVDALVWLFDMEKQQLLLLLIKRKNEPYAEHWALPGGFIDMDEDIATAVYRELQEETGLTGLALTQWYTIGTPGRDPRGRTISVVYVGYANYAQLPPLQAQDDAADLAWFDIKQLPSLAFDHAEIIERALHALRTTIYRGEKAVLKKLLGENYDASGVKQLEAVL